MRTRLLLGAAIAFIVSFSFYVTGQDHPLDQSCPRGARNVRPSELHFEPGVVQHRSWVGVPPDVVTVGEILVVCTDGRAIGRATMDAEDLESDVVQLEIPTRWVDLMWLSGKLDAYHDLSRWVVVFPPFQRAQ